MSYLLIIIFIHNIFPTIVNKMIKNNFTKIVETPILKIKINVTNKQQYILMMEAIASTSFKGIKYIFPAIFSAVLFILTWSLAYNTTLGQIVMITSITIFVISTIMRIKLSLERLSFIKSIPKKAEKLQYPTSFKYQFYKDGIYTKNQDLVGFFNYNSFQSICVYEKGIQFLFRFKNSSIGSQLYATYKVGSFWMPLSNLEEKEVEEVIMLMKELKEVNIHQ